MVAGLVYVEEDEDERIPDDMVGHQKKNGRKRKEAAAMRTVCV